jgi:molecular chaperone DnaK
MSKVLGIDLGTTNTVMAAVEGGEAVILPNRLGNRLTPSVVAFSRDGDILVGETAKNQAVLNSDHTILSAKRYMGTDHKFKIDDANYTPQEISSLILAKLKADAEDFLGEKITEAVITVPAYFNDNQRKATIEAGKMAGLDVLRIINEPTAAALAYGHGKDGEETVLVYDLGGGTFDVSVLELGEGVYQVKSTCGINRLGGDDFDNRLINFLVEGFKRTEGIDLSVDKMSMQKLKEESEKAKILLSEMAKIKISIPFITADANGPKHLEIDFTRSDFENMIGDYIEQTREPIRDTVTQSELEPSDFSRVILVGGSTKMPVVSRLVKDELGIEPGRGINPDECVALGAAIQGAILKGDVLGVVLVDVTPFSLGIETEGERTSVLIPRNSTIPTAGKRMFTTISDYQSEVEIHALQGENEEIYRNISLGRFRLTNIRPAKQGEPNIEVTFELDVNGVLEVSARDLDTGSRQNVVIKNKSIMSPEKMDEFAEMVASINFTGESDPDETDDMEPSLDGPEESEDISVDLEDISEDMEMKKSADKLN